MDIDGLAQLLTPDGFALLEEIGEYSSADSLALSTRLRQAGHSPELVVAALTQAQLRQAARPKFGEFAADMLFTRDGLEQATRMPVAARHAQRLVAAGADRIADLGCGIGGDAMAIAGMGPRVLAVDADEVTAAIATVNLRHFETAIARQQRAEDVDLSEFDAVWLDPARRKTKGRRGRGQASRIFDPEAFSPPVSWAVEAAQSVAAAGIKLGPALPHSAIPAGAQAQWISHHGDVVEAALWFGDARRVENRRSALVIGADAVTEVGEDRLPAVEPDIAPLGRYLLEPDGAIIRAGLVTALTGPFRAWQIHPSIAYLSSDQAVLSPLAEVFEVAEVLPLHTQALRTRMRELEIGTLEIKKRGADIVPEELRTSLKLRGSQSATLFCTRIGPDHRAILAHRVSAPAD